MSPEFYKEFNSLKVFIKLLEFYQHLMLLLITKMNFFIERTEVTFHFLKIFYFNV